MLFPSVLWMMAVISWCALDGYCYFVVCHGWSLLLPVVPWIVAVISSCDLDDYCYFLMCREMVTVISWCAVDGHCYFLVCSGWSLLFPSVVWMVAVIS